MYRVSQLFIYPIKSLAGSPVNWAEVTEKGFKHDRRFMIVDRNNRLLTIREFPKMTRLLPVLEGDVMHVQSLDTEMGDLRIRVSNNYRETQEVKIWSSQVRACSVSKECDTWFSEALGAHVKLVYMPEGSRRVIKTASGKELSGKLVSFADSSPFMMLGQASLTDLNSRFPPTQTFDIHRFRPNLVFEGGTPYQEDNIGSFTINGITFQTYEKCARCTVPNVNPHTGAVDKNAEPLATLAKYRLKDGKIYFGVHLIHRGGGGIQVGDELHFN